MNKKIYEDEIYAWFEKNKYITIDEKSAARMVKELLEMTHESPRQNCTKEEEGIGEWSGTSIQSGGVMTWPDGETVTIHESKYRIGLEFHGRTVYEFFYYNNHRPGHHDDHHSDVIQFRVLPAGDYNWTGWLMNVEDTVQITSYLLEAARLALQDGHSPGPLFDEIQEKANDGYKQSS